MNELQDTMAHKISELDQRVSDHEQRLAAIERAATCGTGPNEPHTNSPAQADVGEASAVSEWPRYYRHKQDRGGYVRYESANEPGRIVRFDGGPAAPWTWTYQQAIEFCLDGTWHEVPAAEAEARIAAARGEKQNCNGCGKPLLPENAWMTDGCPCNSPKGCNDTPPFHVGQVVECVAYPTESLKIGDRRKIVEAEIISGRPCYRLEGLEFGIFGDCHNRRFRVVESTPTAERESGPTPGMVAAAKNIGMYCDRQGPEYKKVSEIVSVETMATVINSHLNPELAALRAECERLNREAWNARLERRKLQEAIAHPDKLFASQVECAAAEPLREARQQLATKDAEIERQRKIINDNFTSTAARVAELEQQLATATAERDEARADKQDAAEKLRAVIMAVSEYTSSPPHRRDDHSCLLCRMLESPDYKTYRDSPVSKEMFNVSVVRMGEKINQQAREIGDLRAQLTTAREAAESHAKDHEAMEWLVENPHRVPLYGFNYSDRKGWFVDMATGVYPTPTAAILAAKAASERKESVE